MKKAVLSLALALLTGASLLAGCAPQATEPDLSLIHIYIGNPVGCWKRRNWYTVW